MTKIEITQQEFESVVHHTMVADDSGINKDETAALRSFVDKAAKAFGYKDWIHAYNHLLPGFMTSKKVKP